MRHCLKSKGSQLLWFSISTQPEMPDMLQGWPPWTCPVHFFKEHAELNQIPFCLILDQNLSFPWSSVPSRECLH